MFPGTPSIKQMDKTTEGMTALEIHKGEERCSSEEKLEGAAVKLSRSILGLVVEVVL